MICRKVLSHSTIQFGPTEHTSDQKERAFCFIRNLWAIRVIVCAVKQRLGRHKFQYNEEVKNAVRVNLSNFNIEV
jgi:hypothetical protein